MVFEKNPKLAKLVEATPWDQEESILRLPPDEKHITKINTIDKVS